MIKRKKDPFLELVFIGQASPVLSLIRFPSIFRQLHSLILSLLICIQRMEYWAKLVCCYGLWIYLAFRNIGGIQLDGPLDGKRSPPLVACNTERILPITYT